MRLGSLMPRKEPPSANSAAQSQCQADALVTLTVLDSRSATAPTEEEEEEHQEKREDAISGGNKRTEEEEKKKKEKKKSVQIQPL